MRDSKRISKFVNGEYVYFTGHGYWQPKRYNYAERFGSGQHQITSQLRTCCNVLLRFRDVSGLYPQEYFSKVPPGEVYPS